MSVTVLLDDEPWTSVAVLLDDGPWMSVAVLLDVEPWMSVAVLLVDEPGLSGISPAGVSGTLVTRVPGRVSNSILPVEGVGVSGLLVD